MGEMLKKSDCTRIISIDELELDYQAFLEKHDASQQQNAKFSLEHTKNTKKYFAINNSVQLQKKIYNFFSELKHTYHWFMIADTLNDELVYALPVINALASSADSIELHILPYVDNEKLSARFLNNSTNSIPQLICVDESTDEILFVWGPRSEIIQQQIDSIYSSNKSSESINSDIALCFAKDAGQSIQQEIYEKFKLAIHNKTIIQDIYQ